PANNQGVYGEYRRQLQLLQWQTRPRRWVLKCPLHAWGLEALLRLFPDACVVQTHRDPAEVVPSACSLLLTGRGVYADDIDPRRRGAEVAPRLAQLLLRPAMRARAAAPERVFDVNYRSLVRDPLGSVRGIYERFGLPLGAAAERNMRGWLARNPQ